MYLTDTNLKNLWDWARAKYTSDIAQRCNCSTQHVRNVLQGKTEDGGVIEKALQLRKQVLLKDQELLDFLLHQIKPVTSK